MDSRHKKICWDEIYKLVFSRCKSVKYFYWHITEKLLTHPSANSNLHSLGINFWEYHNFTNAIRTYQNIENSLDLISLETITIIKQCDHKKTKEQITLAQFATFINPSIFLLSFDESTVFGA